MCDISDSLIKISNDEKERSDSNHIGVHIVGIHHCHAVSCWMMVFEVEWVVWGVVDQIFKDRHSFLVERLDIGALTVWLVCTCIEYRQIFAKYILHYILTTSAMPESD